AAALWFVFLRPSGPTGPSVALAMTFPKGRSVDYRVSLSMDGTLSVAGRSLDVSASVGARMSVYATAVDARGVTTVRIRATRLIATVNGQRVRSRRRTSVVRIARDGRVLGDGNLFPSSNDGPLNVLPGSGSLALLPDHPVHVGDEWKNEFSIPVTLGSGSADVSTSSKLTRYQ